MGAVLPIRKDDGLDRLVAIGASLTPLKGKQPYRKGWPGKGVRSAETAREWLHKGENVGLITGEASGVVVVDVDPRNGGEASLYDLEQAHGTLPDTLTCQTGGNGLHLYFKHFPEAKSGTPVDGIDFKAGGGCVVVPPSIHPDTKALYQWADLDVDVAELPQAWREAMAGKAATHCAFEDDGGPIPEGKRNNTLFNIARLLFKQGDPEPLVRSRIEEANEHRCQTPLEPSEVAQIIAAAYRYRGGDASPLSLLQAAAWRWPLPSIHKLTLLALASFADTQSLKAYPTQEQIALRAGITDRRVRAVLKDLEAQGWFTRSTHRRSQGSGFNHSYQIRVPEVAQ